MAQAVLKPQGNRASAGCTLTSDLMMADYETSETSEVMEQQSKRAAWGKPLVVGLCIAFGVAAMVAMKGTSASPHDATESDVISLQATATFSDEHKGCMDSKCCTKQGNKCFAKNQWWAQCQDTCVAGTVDPWDNMTWSCDELNETSTSKCAKDHEDCRANNGKCCRSDWVCYIKHNNWANCNADCLQGPKANSYDTETDSWSCEIHMLDCVNITDPNTTTPKDLLNCCQNNYCGGTTCTGDNVNKCVYYEKEAAAAAMAATTAPTPAPPAER